jgi:hypothetical protein
MRRLRTAQIAFHETWSLVTQCTLHQGREGLNTGRRTYGVSTGTLKRFYDRASIRESHSHPVRYKRILCVKL